MTRSSKVSKQREEETRSATQIERFILTLNCADFVPQSWQYAGPALASHGWFASECTRVCKSEWSPEGQVLADPTWTGTFLKSADGGAGVCFEHRQLARDEFLRNRQLGTIPTAASTAFRVRQHFIAWSGRVLSHSHLLSDHRHPLMPQSFNGDHVPLFPSRPELFTGRAAQSGTAVDVAGAFWRIIHENWSVAFAAGPSGALLRFPTSAESLRDMFRLRDVEPGLSRRKALVHMVRSHRRRVPDAGHVDVSEYLRGRATFDWFSLRGMIFPPASHMTSNWLSKLASEIQLITSSRKGGVA